MTRFAAWRLFGLAAMAASAAAHGAGKPLPLPDVRQPVALRVAYLHNPRFETLPAERLGRILALAAGHLREHLGLAVSFSQPVEVPIGKAFAAIDPRFVKQAESQRLDTAINDFAMDRLARNLLKDLTREGGLQAQKRFAAPYLSRPPADGSDIAFARALIDTQLTLLGAWRRTLAADGKPLIGIDRFNEYTYWDVLGSATLPYEVVITNQLIASAEWEGNSVHSALRGGVSNGITTQSRAGRFQLYSVVSSFPFVDASAQTTALRGGDVPTPAEADNYMALLLAHELGHQLLHLGHPFGNTRCLMAPPPVLRFREWAAGLSAAGCPLGRRGTADENAPGFVRFPAPAVVFR